MTCRVSMHLMYIGYKRMSFRTFKLIETTDSYTVSAEELEHIRCNYSLHKTVGVNVCKDSLPLQMIWIHFLAVVAIRNQFRFTMLTVPASSRNNQWILHSTYMWLSTLIFVFSIHWIQSISSYYHPIGIFKTLCYIFAVKLNAMFTKWTDFAAAVCMESMLMKVILIGHWRMPSVQFAYT